MQSSRPRLGQLLVEARIITSEQLSEVLTLQKSDGRRLGTLLVEVGYANETQLTQILSQQLNAPWVSLYHIDFSRQLLNLVPREVAEKYCLVPIYVRHVRGQGDTLYVAMDDPTNEEALKACSASAGLPARAMIAPPSDIRSAIRVYYGARGAAKPEAGTRLTRAEQAPAAAPSDPEIELGGSGLHVLDENDEIADDAFAPGPPISPSPIVSPPPPTPSTRFPAAAQASSPPPAPPPAAATSSPPPPPPPPPCAPPPATIRGVSSPPPPPRPVSAPPSAGGSVPPAAAPGSTPPAAGPSQPPGPGEAAPASGPRQPGVRPAAAAALLAAVSGSTPPPGAVANGEGAPSQPPGEIPETLPEVMSLEHRPRRARRAKMISLTLLDGTTLNLPARGKRARAEPALGDDHPPPSGEETQLTARDLVAALRAVTHGADASEILGENAKWEAMFAALLSLLLKKHLIADWEFIEELKKI